VDYINKTFLSTVLVVANWFDNSPVRSADLRKLQLDNDEDVLKMIKALAARWLSSDRAVQALRKSLASVIQTLLDPKRKNEAGIGCVKILTHYKFIATLELFGNTLPHLSQLSLIFQSRRVNFSTIASQVAITRQLIQAKKEVASTALAATREAVAKAKADGENADADDDEPMAPEAKDGKDAKSDGAAVAPPAAASVDPLMDKIVERLNYLRGRDIKILHDSPKARLEFALIRAQWLQALDDQLARRFPEPELFANLSTVFTPSNLPATAAGAMLSSHGAEEIKRLAARLSAVRTLVPPLAEQLQKIKPLSSQEKKERKKKAKADAKAAVAAAADAAGAEGDDDVVMLDKPVASASSSSSSSSSALPPPAAASSRHTAYCNISYLDPKLLCAEWPSALQLLVYLRDHDASLKQLRMQANPRQPDTCDLVRAFVTNDQARASFPNVVKLAALALTIPVTTVECERGYSAMNYVKGELRNRLNEQRLSDLMRVYLEGPELLDKSLAWRDILLIWYSRKNRKVALPSLATAAPASSIEVPVRTDADGDAFML